MPGLEFPDASLPVLLREQFVVAWIPAVEEWKPEVRHIERSCQRVFLLEQALEPRQVNARQPSPDVGELRRRGKRGKDECRRDHDD